MPKLIEQNIIVLGSLNPAILAPNWLASEKVRVLAKGEKVTANISFGSNRPAEFQSEKYQWSIDYSMLKVNISPEEDSSLLMKFIVGIFSELKHTPVTGIGHNLLFEESSWPKEVTFSSNESWKVPEQSKWGPVINLVHEVKIGNKDKGSININLKNDLEKTLIRFNFHCDVTSADELTTFVKEIHDNNRISNEILEEMKK